MTDPRTFVIAGGGLAGARAARALRAQGFTGRVVLLGDEPDPPYVRIGLSKDYLVGRVQRRALEVCDPRWYIDHAVELRTGTALRAIDRMSRSVEVCRVDGGRPETLGYDRLLIATGARAKALPVPGADAPGVLRVRTAADADALRRRLSPGARVVVVGAGWLGLETAAAARVRGAAVTVLARGRAPLARLVGQEISALFVDRHRGIGVDLRTETGTEEIVVRGGRVAAVRTTDGEVPADVVVTAVGARPNTEVAAAAGLGTEPDGGLRTDARLRTDDPEVFAAGDVAAAWHPLYDTRIRVEHWANALNQPAVAAGAMLGGDRDYRRLPYFFSDQVGLDMEFSGHLPPGGLDHTDRARGPGLGHLPGLLDRRRYCARGDEHQHLGRDRRAPGPDPQRAPGRPGGTGRSTGPADRAVTDRPGPDTVRGSAGPAVRAPWPDPRRAGGRAGRPGSAAPPAR